MKWHTILVFFAVYAAGQTVVLNEPLTGGKTGGIVQGGLMTSEGYKPSSRTGHLLFQLPQPVVHGMAEFEVKGMSHAAVPADGNHGFFCMYDGRGISEPAQYFRDYKDNFFRWNVHWRQNRAAVKGVITCSKPGKSLLNNRAVDAGRDWSEEPTGSFVAWDPAKWHKFRIEWEKGSFRVFVDGSQKWSVTGGPYDYAPGVHRVWLGGAPNNGDKYANLVPGITYRNFRVIDVNGNPAKIQGRPQNQGVSFGIFPNPFRGQLTVDFPAGQGFQWLGLFDGTGRLVFSETGLPSTGPFSIGQGLSPGVYFLRLGGPKGTFSRRLTLAP